MPLLGLPALPELLLIFGALVLLFGGKKLPELGGAIGESIKNFKKGVKDDDKVLPLTTDDQNAKSDASKPNDPGRG